MTLQPLSLSFFTICLRRGLRQTALELLLKLHLHWFCAALTLHLALASPGGLGAEGAGRTTCKRNILLIGKGDVQKASCLCKVPYLQLPQDLAGEKRESLVVVVAALLWD